MPKELGVAVAGAAEAFAWLTGREPGFTRFRVKFSCWNRYFDIRKARQMLGYEPIVGLYDGLVESIKWFENEEKRQSEKKGQ
jgi:sterol-4alpha-carboxylate 3-dehydrogenase (decarboxylating)